MVQSPYRLPQSIVHSVHSQTSFLPLSLTSHQVVASFARGSHYVKWMSGRDFMALAEDPGKGCANRSFSLSCVCVFTSWCPWCPNGACLPVNDCEGSTYFTCSMCALQGRGTQHLNMFHTVSPPMERIRVRGVCGAVSTSTVMECVCVRTLAHRDGVCVLEL